MYLDDQSGQLPGRNLDVYAADLEDHLAQWRNLDSRRQHGHRDRDSYVGRRSRRERSDLD